ncbi:2Fe-2S iron-sulfur cluster-binding protein [Chloroflexota bacterium]
MDKVSLTIDDIAIQAPEGERLLWAALDNDIYIPNLCAIRQAEIPFGGCRLCFVEIEGRNSPITACSQVVEEGMIVRTNTSKVRRLRRTAFELLLSHHALDCRNCTANGHCELQRIASRLGLKLRSRRFRPIPRSLPVDSSHPLFVYDPNKCVLCGKCVWQCNEKGAGNIDFTFRGIDTMISPFANMLMEDSICNNCMDCIDVCPVGALVPKDSNSNRR